MKFGHDFKAALEQEGFPRIWIESAIPYGQLKKVIKNVARELEELGLDRDTLQHFVPTSSQDGRRGSYDGSVAFKYDFDGDRRDFRPKLTIFYEDDIAVNATLSPETRRILQERSRQAKSHPEGNIIDVEHEDTFDTKVSTEIDRELLSPQTSIARPVLRQVELNLSFDSEFFSLLSGEITTLGTIQAREQKALVREITELSHEIQTLVKPSRFGKTDMYRWRELLDTYLESDIFISTKERNRGYQGSGKAARNLDFFKNEVTRRGIPAAFKLQGSQQAFDRFVNINVTLLRNLKFNELNEMALTKIMKKFDKKTSLAAVESFQRHFQTQISMTMSETMAKAVCAQVSTDLVPVTPSISDYNCPLCEMIVWRPIRLNCGHVFCSGCTVKMQRRGDRNCPLCRAPVIMEATPDNIDDDLTKLLWKHFPKETREKKIHLETLAGREQFGIYYKHPSEQKCVVQ